MPTGKKWELWKTLNDFVGPSRQLITIWCVADRSDLAFETNEYSIPQVQHWMSDIKNVVHYCRATSVRFEELESFGKAYNFPRPGAGTLQQATEIDPRWTQGRSDLRLLSYLYDIDFCIDFRIHF